MTAYIFISLFVALSAVYFLFLFRIRQGLAFLSDRKPIMRNDFGNNALHSYHISVIVPARNEERNIEACIKSLKAQEYVEGKLEILIVDDASDDDTVQRARTAIQDDQRFRIIQMNDGDPDQTGKKAAINRGVSAAKGEIILTTDADCTHHPQWARAMTVPFANGCDVAAGPVVFRDRSNLFRRLQALEFLGLMGVGAGFFGIGYPRLCNGASLAYRKSMFEKTGGYDGNSAIASGDDEFLMHKIVYQAGGSAEFVPLNEAVVETPPSASFGDFLAQRVRWSSKGAHYNDKRFVSFLVLLFFYMCFCAAAPVVACISTTTFLFVVLLLAGKWIADGSILVRTAHILGAPVRLGDILIAEIFHPYYLVVVTIIGTFGNAVWKGRKVKRR